MGTTKTQLLRHHGSNILPLHHKPCLIFRLLNRNSESRNLLFNVHNKLDLGAVLPSVYAILFQVLSLP